MTDSVCMGSVVVCGEVAAGGVDFALLPEQPVVPDAGGEGEHALADACPDAVGDVPAVLLEGELALGGVVDRLDPLAHTAEFAEPWLLAFAVRADECGVQGGNGFLELSASEALVGDDGLAALEHPLLAGAFEHRGSDLALSLVRGREGEVDGHPVRCAQQVQPQTPEVAAVAGAIPVGSPARELGALDRLPGGATRHRGGVQQPQPVVERRGDPSQLVDDQTDPWGERPYALVVARFLGDIGEQVRKPAAGEAQEAPLGMAVQKDLRDRERDELGVGDLWVPACTLTRRQEIVHQHVKCGEQAVKVGVHEATSVGAVAIATPTFDSPPLSPRATPTPHTNTESVIY